MAVSMSFRKAIDYIDGDETVWAREPIERITKENQFKDSRHDRFWSCRGTFWRKNYVEELSPSSKVPWKVW
jgi:glucose-1-phosphate cytidylyltransferase